jgi:hypothetical protein
MLTIKHIKLLAGLMALAGLAGCQTNQQFLEQNQAAAMQATMARAAFDLNCPNAQPTLISSKVSQPVTAFGYERTEYTIGVRGCGKQAVYITWCLNSETCNAINDSNSALTTY